MASPELIANSPIPGTEPAIGTLTAAITSTPAPGTVETIKTQSVQLPALQPTPGQFRIRIDAELMLVTAGQNTTTGPNGGQVEYSWAQSDLLPSVTPELYDMEWEIEYLETGGVKHLQTVPNRVYKLLEVVADLGGVVG